MIVKLFILFLVSRVTSGIAVSKGTLLSIDPTADCTQYRPMICEGRIKGGSYEPSKLPQTFNVYTPGENAVTNNVEKYEIIDHNLNTFVSNLHDVCPNENTSCSVQSLPQVSYQFIYQNHGGWERYIILQIKWNAINKSDCGIPEKYHILLTTNEEILKTCSNISTNNVRYVTRDNTVNEIHFAILLSDGVQNIYNFKVIGYPVYEYPTFSIVTPPPCSSNIPGCQLCDKKCYSNNMYTVPQPKLSVSAFITSSNTISANISWTHYNVIEYYLHINSSTIGKRLYKIDGGVKSVLVTGIPYDDDVFVYIEQFYCECSEPSEVYYIHEALNESNIDFSLPDLHPSSSQVQTTSSYSTITTTPLPDIIPSSDPAYTSPLAVHHTPISVHDTTMITSFKITPSSNVTRTANDQLQQSALYIPIVVTISVLALFVAVVVIVIVLVLLRERERRRKRVGDHEHGKLPPHDGLGTPDHQTSVIIIIPDQDPKKEEYLKHLYNLTTEYGITLLMYDRSNRESPAEWLNTAFHPDKLVLTVINKQFNREWMGEYKADIPIVFALKQLINCQFQQSKELKNFALVLPTPSDNKHIPSILQSLRKFKLTEIEEITRFVYQVPEFECN